MSMDKEVEYIKLTIPVISPTMEAILTNRAEELTNDTYEPFDNLIGDDVLAFIAAYQGGNNFLNSVKSQKNKGKVLSIAQKRATAEMIRKALRGEDLSYSHGFGGKKGYNGPYQSTPTTTQAPAPAADVNLIRGLVVDNRADALQATAGTGLYANECYVCHKYVVGDYSDLKRHKDSEHARPAATSEYGANSKNQNANNVVVRSEPKHNIDVRSIFPDQCRIAVPQADGSNNFYIIKTVQKQMKLTGRFRWSKYPVRWSNGFVQLPANTIIVRKQSGDTKEFVGMQATDDPVYFGEYEDDILAASKDVIEAMQLYGKLIGACCYCGKTLTDHESKKLGIGPDCFENKYVPALRAGVFRKAGV